jgi:D-alanyl-D-alanine carboxypeptidase (penicillin-binding protein 5/6)
MLNHLIKIISIIILTLTISDSYAIETNAKQAFLIDATTGTVLFAKNEDERMTPSSMSKLMTCYLVFDALKTGNLSLEEEINVSVNAWQMKGSKTFVPVDKKVKVEDLIRGVIVQSGNDASVVLAEGMAGKEDEFAKRLNSKAKELGMTNSNFKNATGWPDPDHYTSAKDLAKLAQHLINQFPEYYKYFSENEFTYNNISQPNRNTLLNKDIGVDGLKTGHTDIAGYGIVASAVRNNRRLILVINGLKDESERATEAQSLLNYGFMNFTNITIAKANEALVLADTWMGASAKVELATKQDIIVTVPIDQKKSIKGTINYLTPIYAPIKTEQPLGKMSIQINDSNQDFQLFAVQNMDTLPIYKRVLIWLKYFFTHWSFSPPKQEESLHMVY